MFIALKTDSIYKSVSQAAKSYSKASSTFGT